jgi:hypothetical protein
MVPPPLAWSLVYVWAAIFLVYVGLLFYRWRIAGHEEEEGLFLKEYERDKHDREVAVESKVERLGPWLKVLGWVTFLYFLVLAAYFIWYGVKFGFEKV